MAKKVKVQEALVRGKMLAVIGGQYGSEGKGTIVAHIANEYRVHVRVGSPNAGHTFYWNGEKHVMQSVPCGWINPEALIVIGRGALINMDLLVAEIEHIKQYYPKFLGRLRIDSKAGILSRRFHEQEGGIYGEMHKKIGSTGEGVGPARVARIMRDPENFTFFGDVAKYYGLEEALAENTNSLIQYYQNCGDNILLEGSQGSGLSLLHGPWPFVTSIDTNAAQILAEIGLPPSALTDVMLVARTYPIRVAGNSGPLNREVTWQELSAKIGRNLEERTTVTKKVRRIGEWDQRLIENAITLNAPTEIALTFANYVDPALWGEGDITKILSSDELTKFIDRMGPVANLIKYIGTGPETTVEVK